MSSTARWVICAVCAVLGVIALIYAIMYLAIPIHSLPGFVPGKKSISGHYHKRAALTAVIGIVLLAIAAWVGYGARRSAAAGAGPTSGAAGGPAPDSADVGGDGGDGGDGGGALSS